MKKRIVSCTLSLTLFLSLLLFSAYAASADFTDVAAGAYYADAVTWAVEKGITSGTTATTFSPDDQCTKAQIITFLWRANGSPEAAINNPFPDLNGSEFYYASALWSYTLGMTSGQAQFNANEPFSRYNSVLYIWIAAGRPAPASQVAFNDVSPAFYNVNAISWAVENGITNGTSATEFSPDTICTRAQIATFLYRSLNQTQNHPNEAPPQTEPQPTPEPAPSQPEAPAATPAPTLSYNPTRSNGNGTYTHDFSGGRVLITTQSNNGGDPVYHTWDCRAAKKIPPDHEGWYDSAQQAVDDGRRLCGYCGK